MTTYTRLDGDLEVSYGAPDVLPERGGPQNWTKGSGGLFTGSKPGGVKVGGQYEGLNAEQIALVQSWEIKGALPTPVPTEWVSDLTKEELTAIDYYKQVGYNYINTNLRDRVPLDKVDKEDAAAVKVLDGVLERATIPADMTLYRGTDLSLFGGSLPPSSVGKVFRDRGFVSTSVDRDIAAGFEPEYGPQVMVQVHAKAGSRGARISSTQDYMLAAEDEVLLPRGTAFRITGIDRTGRGEDARYVVDLEVVP